MATTLPSSRREAFAQWWQLRSRSERILLAAAAGIAASEWLIRYVQSRRIGKRSR